MFRIFKENLRGVRDAKVLLRLSTSAIDARRRFGGVTTHEAKGGYDKGKRKRTVRLELTPACRGEGHWHHAQEECVQQKGQQDLRQLR